MRRLVVGFFAAVGFLTVLLLFGVFLLTKELKPIVTPLADNIILTVDLTQGLAEGPRQDRLLRLLLGSEPSLRDVLDGIETASSDPRVKVFLARVGDDELDPQSAAHRRCRRQRGRDFDPWPARPVRGDTCRAGR